LHPFPEGHPDLVTGLTNLGQLFARMGKTDKALAALEQALAMNDKLYPESEFPEGHIDLVSTYNAMATVLEAMGRSDKALPYMEKAIKTLTKLYPESKYPEGPIELPMSLNNLGFVLTSLGRFDKALPAHERAVAILTKRYPKGKFPNGHPDLAGSFSNLGYVLMHLGLMEKALNEYEKALQMRQTLYPESKFPNGHPALAESLNNLANLLSQMGMLDKAFPHYQKSAVVAAKLYPESKFPDGYPDLAASLLNLGGVLRDLGRWDEALAHQEKALAMYTKLYPKSKFPEGHPFLATSLSRVGIALDVLGKPEKALLNFEKALAMDSNLYPESKHPNGHPRVVGNLDNCGFALARLGKTDHALTYFQKAVAMNRKLYPERQFPDGHPLMVPSINGLATILLRLGRNDEALGHFEKAVAMESALARRTLAVASESSALAFLRNQTRSRDGVLLSCLENPEASNPTRFLPPSWSTLAPMLARRTAPQYAERSYAAVWSTRVPLLQLMLQRCEAASVARSASAEARETWRRLGEVRRALSLISANPPKDLKERDKDLATLQAEQKNLERVMNRLLPELSEHQSLSKAGPDDLAAVLPEKSAFVDVVRYMHINKDASQEWRYLAFVLTHKSKVKRILFDSSCTVLDQAVSSWRQAIAEGKSSAASGLLRERLWAKIEAALPKDTDTIFLCLDGDLTRLPFAALPGASKDSILLERYAFATVPSGQWLLQQLLTKPDTEGNSTSLILGGVDFGAANGKGDYARLPASETEAKTIATLLGDKSPLLGNEATVSAVRKRLAQARIAHLATHAYFDAKALSADHKRHEQERTSQASRLTLEVQTGTASSDVWRVTGVQNPLGFVGIALAGINERNDPKAKVDGGGVLTGLDILELPLQKMQLCVLSACETGLGAWNEEDGVAGLHRALHVAGCRNVVGSLWNVNDSATAALMRTFYHELLVNKRPALQALREAQLTIYRHPERIKALAGERGKIDFDNTVKLGSGVGSAKVEAKRANARLWAAFMLSGPGN
jgi:CHAT domain-containing protein/Tfp pilus assembly protein PilF